jgi:hypothetical protein
MSRQTLRERFAEFQDGAVPFEEGNGIVHEVPTADSAVYDEIHQDGRLCRPQRWRGEPAEWPVRAAPAGG